MSLIVLLYSLILPSAMNTETPDEFLEILASGDAEIWVEHQLTDNPSTMIPPDSIRSVLELKRNLSVDSGERILQDVEGGYRVIFPETRWTWRMDGGRIGSISGETVIEWHPGGYSWVAVPLMKDEGKVIGPKESLCIGVTITGAVLFVGMIGVWYAKRRYS